MPTRATPARGKSWPRAAPLPTRHPRCFTPRPPHFAAASRVLPRIEMIRRPQHETSVARADFSRTLPLGSGTDQRVRATREATPTCYSARRVAKARQLSLGTRKHQALGAPKGWLVVWCVWLLPGPGWLHPTAHGPLLCSALHARAFYYCS